jgi:hypothetical protein
MASDKLRIFVVHSKSRPWQSRLYDTLEKRLAKLDVQVTHYAEWSWATPGGVSDRERENQAFRHKQGYRELQGMGWIQNPPPELALVLGRPARENAVNKHDLARLITDSSLIVLVEDPGQETVSDGVNIELDILRGSGKRTVHVRICDDVATAYGASAYPLNDPQLSGGAIALRRLPNGDFSESDLELVVLLIALWCDDTPARHGVARRPNEPKHDPNFTICPVSMSPRGMFRYESTLRLAASDDDHVRRCTLMYISTCHDHLRHELCRFLGRMMMKMNKSSRHLDDYLRFMELTPDIDWSVVVRSIETNPVVPSAPKSTSVRTPRPWWRFWG